MEQELTIPPEIVRKAGQGNGDAQALLYRQYSKAMFNICIRMTGNRGDAEDVLQDAFIQAFKKLSQLKQPEAFAGWLRRIVVNECISFSKKSFFWDDWQDVHNNYTEEETTHWWLTISLDLIHREIKSLPDGCRQVFVLFVLEDYSHKHIAECLGVSESTSKSQYHRARKLLKERITKQMDIING